jgi:hypothetical protein
MTTAWDGAGKELGGFLLEEPFPRVLKHRKNQGKLVKKKGSQK